MKSEVEVLPQKMNPQQNPFDNLPISMTTRRPTIIKDALVNHRHEGVLTEFWKRMLQLKE
jgi:hypothetical protein